MSLPNKILPVPAANAAILNDRGEILLTRRAPGIREPGKWCLPGGHVEPGEKWWNAVCREVKEETGLTVLAGELLGIYSDPELTITPIPYYGDWHGQFLAATFIIHRFSGDVIPNEEVDLWGWYRPGNLPQPMLRSHPVRIQDAFRYQGVPFVR